MPTSPVQPAAPSAATREPAAPLSWQQALHDLLTDRCAMMSIESRQALRDVMARLVLATVAAGLLLLGWLTAMAALIAHLSTMLKLPWWMPGYVAAVVHFIIAVILLQRFKSKSLRYFTHTINEFEKDRTWILNLTQPRSKP